MSTETDTPATDAPEIGTTPAATPASAGGKWQSRVGAFSAAVKQDPVKVGRLLIEHLTGADDDDAADSLADPAVSDELIKTALADLKIPPAQFLTKLPILRGKAPAGNSAAASNALSLDFLPVPLDDENFANELTVGGTLKAATPVDIQAATRVAFAASCNFFTLPTTLLRKMEEVANATDEPYGTTYYKVRASLTARRYGNLFRALGVPGMHVSIADRNEFLRNVTTVLWTSLRSYNTQLQQWIQLYLASAPQMMMAGALGGAARGAIPGLSMMASALPDATPLQIAARGVLDQINKIFSRMGIPTARALATDALEIKKLLSDSSLPALVGATSKEVMLKTLGVAVGPEFPMMETSLVRFVLAILQLPTMTGDSVYEYLAAMARLGTSIKWDLLVEIKDPVFAGRKRSGSGVRGLRGGVDPDLGDEEDEE